MLHRLHPTVVAIEKEEGPLIVIAHQVRTAGVESRALAEQVSATIGYEGGERSIRTAVVVKCVRRPTSHDKSTGVRLAWMRGFV